MALVMRFFSLSASPKPLVTRALAASSCLSTSASSSSFNFFNKTLFLPSTPRIIFWIVTTLWFCIHFFASNSARSRCSVSRLASNSTLAALLRDIV